MKRSICLMLCFALAAALWGCQQPQTEQPAAFYYRRTETAFQGSDGVIAPEERELAERSGDLGALLDLYCAGPITPGLENPLPPGTCVQSFRMEDGTLYLDFDPGLANLTGIDLTLAAGCLTRTFLELTGADTLVLSAGDALLNGQTAMRLSLTDLEVRDSSLDRLHRELTVYYTDRERRYLIGQEITLAPAALEELPLTLLELLLSPPESSGLYSPLPEGTRFLSATVSDGLCSVDLSPEFEGRKFYSHASQLLSLMSMVNTLTGLPEIDRVEFTVEGRALFRYGPLTITGPLVRDERCLGPVRTGLGERDVTLYLAHGEDGRLLGVPVRLARSTTLTQAELILRHLLDDPGLNGIATQISPGTSLRSVQVADGVCLVDLSREYLNDPDSLVIAGRVIAASLCTLEDIRQVQITVEGTVPEGFDNTWFGPLRPNIDWYL